MVWDLARENVGESEKRRGRMATSCCMHHLQVQVEFQLYVYVANNNNNIISTKYLHIPKVISVTSCCDHLVKNIKISSLDTTGYRRSSMLSPDFMKTNLEATVLLNQLNSSDNCISNLRKFSTSHFWSY